MWVSRVTATPTSRSAENGTLAYIPAVDSPRRTLVWVDRKGNESALEAPAGPYVAPRISPDGKKIALAYRTDAIEDLWVHDLERRTTEAVVAEPASEWLTGWTADSQRVLFTSRRAGPFPSVFTAGQWPRRI